ncbi:MAG: hypothetical protein ABSF18_07685 [Gammaproteobacteria bacterium]|jgi:hypothetical protein
MRFDTFFDVLGGIVILAIVTDIFTSKNTASDVTAGGNAFSNILNSALGKG